ncbi:UNKNOWN [Stylonychia lemnae]|uniref:Transmembrane protein n=1 Tax=Stylonychia lemnae TaxID=5949 RepID=A0A078B4A4_STYLE|nr:UNKNOWN [Stylonychia lemnae]|eukprot:CDW88042.1 UNKNOWN [Stylonychia lemnae]
MKRKIVNYIKSLDMYGYEVKLLFEGGGTKKSMFGGLVTVFSMGLLFGLFGFQILDILNYKSVYKETIVELDNFVQSAVLNQDNFDTALIINYPDYLSQYSLDENINRYNKTHFLNETWNSSIQLCFDFDQIQFQSFDDRITFEINNFGLSNAFTKVIKYTVQINKANDAISRIYEKFQQQSYEFNSITPATIENIDRSGPDSYMTITYSQSSKLIMISRQVINILQALASIGGLAGMFFGLFGGLVKPLQEFLFYQELVHSSFLVEKDKVYQNMFKTMDIKGLAKTSSNKEEQSVKNNDEDQDALNQDKTCEEYVDYSKLKPYEFDTYLKLVKEIQNRVPFLYSPFEKLKEKVCKLFCLKKKFIQNDLFQFAKKELNKQLDLGIVLEEVKQFRMIKKLLLTDYQRKLLPYLKKSLLNKKFEKSQKQQQAKEKGNQSQNQNSSNQDVSRQVQSHQNSDNVITNFLIDLFANQENSQNPYNGIILNSLFNTEVSYKTLKQKLYSGLLRKFIFAKQESKAQQPKKRFSSLFSKIIQKPTLNTSQASIRSPMRVKSPNMMDTGNIAFKDRISLNITNSNKKMSNLDQTHCEFESESKQNINYGLDQTDLSIKSTAFQFNDFSSKSRFTLKRQNNERFSSYLNNI